MDGSIEQQARGPLVGIRVLDLSAVVSGPMCGQTLADLGAETIKLEPVHGDSTRRMGPPFEAGLTPLFSHCNRNKRAIAVDLKSDDGRAVARELALRTDVLVENFRPGVAERLGLGYESLAAENPGLVYAAISGFGPEGPYRDLPAYDTVMQGLAGFMPRQTDAGVPQLVQSIIADKSTALTATYSIVAALFERERGAGKGQLVHVPMLDAFATFMLTDVMGPATFPDAPPGPSVPNIYLTFATADGYIVGMLVEDHQFFGMCRAIEREDLVGDPRCKDLISRLTHAAELLAIISAEVRKWTTAELVERARANGAPVAPVNDIPDFFEDPQVQANGTVFDVEHEEVGRMRMLRSPPRFSRTPTGLRRMPPRLGEQTDEILSELGYEPARIRALREAGAVL